MVRNRQSEASGCRRTGISQAYIDAVIRAVEQDPDITSHSKQVANINQSTFNRITRMDLNWHPYRIQPRHGLQEGDAECRMAFYQELPLEDLTGCWQRHSLLMKQTST